MSKTFRDKVMWQIRHGKKSDHYQRLNKHVSRTARKLYFWRPERADEHAQLHDAAREANTPDINNNEINVETKPESFDGKYDGGSIPK